MQLVPQPVTRRTALGAGTLGMTSLVLPKAPAASSTSGGAVSETGNDGDWTQIPYPTSWPNGGQRPASYAGVSVDYVGPLTSGVHGAEGYFMFVAPDFKQLTLTFSPTVLFLQLRPSDNADALAEGGEVFTITFFRGSSNVGSASIANSNDTRTFAPSGGFDKVRIDFASGNDATASRLDIYIPTPLP